MSEYIFPLMGVFFISYGIFSGLQGAIHRDIVPQLLGAGLCVCGFILVN